ncbi:MAG: polysaccharide biosynthesis protein [Acidobacteriota bacterium]
MFLDGKRVLVTGGTGSLGRALVRRLLDGASGRPEFVAVFSRDEAKQQDMRLDYLRRIAATDDIVYRHSHDKLRFQIGDIRDYASVVRALRDADVVIHAAALKQVPVCEYFPAEAVHTNVLGAQNLVRAVREQQAKVQVVVGVSTDKACKPINVMGMTKALMERILVEANASVSGTRFVAVRYGNVIGSRGSVIPLFLQQIASGGPVTVTLREMTRFFISMDRAVDTVFAALLTARPGETIVPKLPSARVLDVAAALMDGREVPIVFTGIRPGEKVHEILVSQEESYRTAERDGYYVISPMLPELAPGAVENRIPSQEYSSACGTLDLSAVRELILTQAARSSTKGDVG